MTRTPRLSKGAVRIVEVKLDELFERLKTRLLGKSRERRLFINFNRTLSLPGIYEQAVTEQGGRVDRDLLDRLVEITSDFIDKSKADAQAQVKKRIHDILQDVDSGARKEAFRTALEGELSDVWGKVTHGVKRIVETQTQHAQTLGTKDGIDQVNAIQGVEDPVVFWIPVRDAALCDECRRVHLMSDGVTPRLWLTSEVESGYHKRGTDKPSWALMHPHCRCTLTSLLPGYTFNSRGQVTFKQAGWNELEHQRGP